MPSSMENGGVTEVLSTSMALARTSMSPVSMLGLTASAARSRTLPVTFSTNSRPRCSALEKSSAETQSGSTTTWVYPQRSRKSQKMRPPWSRLCHAQPVSTTSLPTSSLRSSPHVAVCMQYSFFKSCMMILASPIAFPNKPARAAKPQPMAIGRRLMRKREKACQTG